MAPMTPRLKILSGASISLASTLPARSNNCFFFHRCDRVDRNFVSLYLYPSARLFLPPPIHLSRPEPQNHTRFFSLPPLSFFFSLASGTGARASCRTRFAMAEENTSSELMSVCSVGGNPVSAFLSWRLQATNACDVTLVWKSGYDHVAQYGISFKYVLLPAEPSAQRLIKGLQVTHLWQRTLQASTW